MAHLTTALTNHEYRQVKAFSKSDLDLVHKSPALLEWSKNAPQGESDTGSTGTGTHSALLEPELFATDLSLIHISEPTRPY